MLTVVMGTIIYIAISVVEKLETIQADRAQKESEEIDWNEYYSNKH